MTSLIDPSELAPVSARRPDGGSVFEMHAHTSDRSLDSGVRADILVKQAAARGLDGVCFTEHNALWHPDDLQEFQDRHEVVVLPAMELGTDAGHVLVFGLDRYRPQFLQLETLRPIVKSEGAVMVLAHPMRAFNGPRPGWKDFPLWFEGVEVINGDHSDSEDGYMDREARGLGLAAIGGSDAHSWQAVGRVATAFSTEIRTLEDLVAAISAGQTKAVDFRPKSASAPGK